MFSFSSNAFLLPMNLTLSEIRVPDDGVGAEARRDDVTSDNAEDGTAGSTIRMTGTRGADVWPPLGGLEEVGVVERGAFEGAEVMSGVVWLADDGA